jgi:crotonobetainyl-CoA:carnitine CoA-transferase CaiB-like acyl-CoA transferase
MAGAVLADWGAEVIKIEHHERGDSMRGLTGTVPSGHDATWEGMNPVMEGANRGKRSIGLNLAEPEGVALLYRLAAGCDVFTTSKLASVRAKLRIDVEDIRAHNPSIIYARGTGHGVRGPDAERGGYDSLDFWYRPGIAMAVKAPEVDGLPIMPSGAFGDHTAALTLAGGIATALFHRERTGEAAVVDMALLAQAMWTFGAGITRSTIWGERMEQPAAWPERIPNPLARTYKTQDDKWIAFICLQGFKYFADACGVLGLSELVADPRFASAGSYAEHGAELARIIAEVVASAPLAEWLPRLERFQGQWAPVQDSVDIATDPQVLANGYLCDTRVSTGHTIKLATVPLQFDQVPTPPGTSPQFNQHCQSILADDLGLQVEEMLDLKVRGIVA